MAVAVTVGCSDDSTERIDEVYRLKNDPTPEHVEAIRTYLEDEDPQVRVTAMYQLVELDVPDARELAVESLEDPDAFVRLMAAQQAERFRGEDVERALAERTAWDDDARVRRRAAESLAVVGGETAMAALGACLTDPIAEVRTACVEGTAKLDPSRHVAALARLLADDPDWKVRVQAARALGLTDDPSVRPDLEAAARQDEHEYVRGAADHALERLAEAPRPSPKAKEGEPPAS